MRRIASVLPHARQTIRYLGLAVCLSLCCAATSKAAPDGLCDAAVIRAARAANVPVDILRALARTSSGRVRNGDLVPWPWSVRVADTSYHFETREAASVFVFSRFMRGARSFGLGCLHANYSASGAAFASIDEMFDPYSNAMVVAERLRLFHSSIGSWMDAVRAWHKEWAEPTATYQARFERIFLSIPPLQPSLSGNPQRSKTTQNRPERLTVDTLSTASLARATDAAVVAAIPVGE